MASLFVPPEPRSPSVARLLSFCTTEDEKRSARALEVHLRSTWHEVVRFRSCIALADLAWTKLSSKDLDHPVRIIFKDFTLISAHYSITTLFQFNETLITLYKWAEGSKVAKHIPDVDVASKAQMLFNKNFPKWEALRHATAHTEQIRREHSRNAHRSSLRRSSLQKSKGSDAMIQNIFEDRTFITIRKGELLTLDVTWESYFSLVAVYDLLHTGMLP